MFNQIKMININKKIVINKQNKNNKFNHKNKMKKIHNYFKSIIIHFNQHKEI